MSDKKLDVGAFFTNRLGHPLGRFLAKGLWKTELVRRFAAKNPEMMRLGSEALVALTSLLEIGGDHPIARFANFVSETLATENLELLEQFHANPDDPELAKKVQEKVDAAVAKAEDAGVVVALEHVHKDDQCAMVSQYVKDATPPPFGGKPGQPPRINPSAARLYPMKMSSALAAGKPLCGLCYPAAPVGKPAEKQDKPKEKDVVPGRNFMEYVMHLQSKEPAVYATFWKAYLLRLDGPDGPDLARKFQEAFNGKHGYEAFRFVVSLPHRSSLGSEEWHHALDALLGQVTPPKKYRDIIEGFVSKEAKETAEMFRALDAWIERSNAARKLRIAEKKAIGEKLDEDWAAQRAARKTRKTIRRFVVLGLLVVLASIAVIDRVTNPDRAASAEQKVESAHE